MPINGDADDRLKSIIERVERLEVDKKACQEDIKEVYLEAKNDGYDTKVIRKVVALRKKDRTQRRTERDVLDTYMRAVGETD